MKISGRIALVLSFPATLLFSGAARAQTPTTERVSVATGGAQGNDDSQIRITISSDGRFVAFESVASNLIAGDTNATRDIFLRDRTTGTTERVSVATGGVEANSYSDFPSISADGRFVAFDSYATNFVFDTNSTWDIFVRDRVNGTTERVNVDSNGAEANAYSFTPSISTDGRFVAFTSRAWNLVVGDTNGIDDAFIRDRQLGTTERVSVNSAGLEADYGGGWPSMSADARFVAFNSAATNLVAGDTNGFYDVFVRDRQLGTTERVSVTSTGRQGDGSSYNQSISADGRFVAFNGNATNLVANDTNGTDDIFVHDRVTGTTECVSVTTSGEQGSAYSGMPAISGDGRFVMYMSEAANLVVGDTNGVVDVFVHDRLHGTTERVSVTSNGIQGNSYSDSYSNPRAISADGRFVAFDSYASNLVPGDTNLSYDVFVRDRGPLPPSAYCTAGTTTNGCSASISVNLHPSVSLANSCYLAVTGVEGQKAGILFYGVNNSGFTPGPWAPGSTSWLCVKAPTQRTPLQHSGGTASLCFGAYQLNWNAYQSAHLLALGNPWSVGDKVFVQAWFRDPFAVKATNLSNAMELTYQP